ncbi:S-layer homology domain-containing protein [Paenibacillus sp. 2TAB23]|uniref:S-layer homology domain-containing protein n=1 Tax=Paenibacillus sp. 2TAB23 TaxID=3233004 RepID=UPI003F9DC1FA
MKYKTLSVYLVITLLIGIILHPAMAFGDALPSFSLAISQPKAGIGQDVRITVEGIQLTDLYGYELRLRYDTSKLRFKSASAHDTGLSVPAAAKDGEIVFAHTKLGKSPGDNGNASLATLAFETIAHGSAAVSLEKIKLVDSKAAAVTITPKNIKVLFIIKLQEEYKAPLDLTGHWAEANVLRAIELGFVTGYPDGTFRPNSLVTRAEYTAMLVRAVQLPIAVNSEVTLNFTDIDHIQAWAKPYIAEAASAGIISGYEDRTFRAQNKINRAEMAVILARTAGFDLTDTGTPQFSDHEQIPSWAKAAIIVSIQNKLLEGRGSNQFAPSAYTTRAEALTAILKLRDWQNML